MSLDRSRIKWNDKVVFYFNISLILSVNGYELWADTQRKC